jgi:hypothetical protein
VIGLRKFQRRRTADPLPQDLAAISALTTSRNVRIVSVTRHEDPWYYWLRGKLLISNMARFCVVVTESADGARSEIHVAFDPWSPSKGMQVLLERPVR